MIDKKICPLCGEDNKCNSEGDICWCYNTDVPSEMLDLVPEEKRGKACICLDCIEKFKADQEKKKGIFRSMRKDNMHMSRTRMMELLKDAEYGVVSTIGKNGFPYGFPMSHVVIDNAIYFHCGINGHKIDNLNFNGRVSFTVVGRTQLIPEIQDTNYESVIAFGQAGLAYGSEKIQALKAIVDKYAKGYEIQGYKAIGEELDMVKVYKIEIQTMTGKERKDGKR